MKHVVVLVSLLSISFGAVAANDCESNLGAARKVLALAEANTVIGAKYECEKRGAKALINEAVDFCDMRASIENVNLFQALAICDRLELVSWRSLGVDLK